MFIAELFTMVMTWKQPKCPSTDKWKKDVVSDCMLSHFSCVWLCNPVDCSLSGSSVHGILWARIGEGNGTLLQYSCLENPMDGGAWKAAVHGVAEGWTRLSHFTFTFHFHALEKERATHSSVLAWRIPGTGEPGGLSSMGSHRVGHDWSDLAAVTAAGQEYWSGCHALLQGIFLTQMWNLLCLLHWQLGSLPIVPLGKPKDVACATYIYTATNTHTPWNMTLIVKRKKLKMKYHLQQHGWT